MEKYIKQCINSIFFQSVRDHKIEIIIVNDGSTDDSMERINDALNDRFGSRAYKNVIGFTIVDLKSNGGAGNALVEGFKAANGDYICYLSADDVLSDVMKTHNQLNHMIDTNSDLSYCNLWYTGRTIDVNKEIVKSSFIFNLDYFNSYILNNHYLTYFFLNFKNPINSSTFMFKKEALSKYGTWDPTTKSDCDGDILLKYSLQGAKITELNCHDIPSIWYRLHDNQLSNNDITMSKYIMTNRNKYKNIVLTGEYPLWLKIMVSLFVGR